VDVRLLGEFAVSDGGVDLTPRGRKQRLLLACLALHAGEAVSVDRLADVLWGDHPPTNPTNSLHAQVASLRRTLPGGVLVTRGAGYALDLGPDDVDVSRFSSRLAEARRLLDAGRHRDVVHVLDEALDGWRGPALAELAFEDFSRPIALRLEEERLAALELRLEANLALGRHATIVAELDSLCEQHPLREHLWAMRMVALYRSGRQAEALRAFSTVRSALVEQLGVEPGAELREAEAMVLAHDAALTAPAPDTRGPIRSGNLTTRLDRFIGRSQECRQLEALVGAERLVTLVGPGGIGKTRLATEVGARLRQHTPDGVWFVDLSGVDPGGSVAATIASVVAELVHDAGPGPGAASGSTTAQLVGALVESAPLLVIDNCEHILDDAALVCQELLERIPGLRVVATSREALGVPGERVVVVPPLDRSAAAELFLDRSGRVAGIDADDDPGAVVRQICERLDDLPLAIELAASRTRALSIDEIDARLDDRFRLLSSGSRNARHRQRALRSVVDWSYDLLEDDERVIFARLSVFAEPAPLEAIESVVGDPQLAAADVAGLVVRLVEKSLVVRFDGPTGTRYGQLQTLRLYAAERLGELGESDAVRARHARWYLDEARRAATGLIGREGRSWRRRVRGELGDLRRALDWFVEHAEADAALALVNGIAWSWFLAAEWHEAVRWFDDALGVAGADDERRALAHQWRAYFAVFADPSVELAVGARAAFARLRTSSSPGRRRAAGLLLASTLNRLGLYEDALDVLAATRDDLEPDDEWGRAMTDLLTANASIRIGDLDEAARAAAASAERFERVGEHSVIVEPIGLLAQLATIRGDLEEGVRCYTDLVERSRDLDLPAYLTYWLVARGIVHLRGGDLEAAANDLAEARDRRDSPVNTVASLLGSARVAALRGRPADAELAQAFELLQRLGDHVGREVALVVLGLDRIARDEISAAHAVARGLESRESGPVHVLWAAIGAAEGDHAAAERHLAHWDAVEGQAVGGNLGNLLAAEHERLRTLLGDGRGPRTVLA
jgi:predicted ATPase/DNA-binding SARP family transcriptional activator